MRLKNWKYHRAELEKYNTQNLNFIKTLDFTRATYDTCVHLNTYFLMPTSPSASKRLNIASNAICIERSNLSCAMHQTVVNKTGLLHLGSLTCLKKK